MSLTCPDPEVINPLYNNGFVLSIAAIPELSFFCKELSMPNVSIPTLEQTTPFVKVPKPSSHLEYGQLTVTINCDEKMANYKALYTWMKDIAFKDNYNQILEWRKQQGDPRYISHDSEIKVTSNATLFVKGPNQSTVAQINFKYLWITDLGGLTFNEDTTESTVVTFTATFIFTDFDFV